MKKKNQLPFDILETHISPNGIVLRIASYLSGIETYVTYPGTTKEELESRKIFSKENWSATFSPDKIGRHLALKTLEMYKELKDGLEIREKAGLDKSEILLGDEFNDPRTN